MALQLAGATVNNIAEVELNSQALRVTPKPIDWGTLGIYGIGAVTGVMAAGLAANSPVFAFRNTTTNQYLLKRILISAGNTGTAFAAGTIVWNAFIARSWSASDTGGTALTAPSKFKAAMAASGIGDMRVSATATLTAGTRTKDGNPFTSLTQSIVATAGSILTQPTEMFRAAAGDYPVIFGQNEGFVMEASVPATGTWTASISIIWEELATYVP